MIKINSAATIRYYKDGQYHRIDGPAIEFKNGEKHWYRNGRRHRLGGPAIILSCGTSWHWIDGKRL